MRRAASDTWFILGTCLFFAAAVYAFTYFTTHLYLDFPAFWMSGKALNSGLDPYNYAALSKLQTFRGEYRTPFWSPIWLAEIMRPIAYLPIRMAREIFALINSGLSVGIAIMVLRLSNIHVTWKAVSICMLGLLSFAPLVKTIRYGQTDIIVTLAILTSAYLMKRGYSFWSGFVLCLASINPHLILGLVCYYLYLIVTRQNWRLLWGASLGTIMIAISCIPYSQYVAEWFRVVIPRAQYYSFHVFEVQTTFVRIFWIITRHHEALTIGLAFTLSVVSLVTALIIWRQPAEARTLRDIAVACVLSLIMSTFGFQQDFLILIGTVPYFVQLWRETGSMRIIAIMGIALFNFSFSDAQQLNGAGCRFLMIAPFAAALIAALQLRHLPRRSVLLFILAVWSQSTAGTFLPLFVRMNYEEPVSMAGLLVFLYLVLKWTGVRLGPALRSWRVHLHFPKFRSGPV